MRDEGTFAPGTSEDEVRKNAPRTNREAFWVESGDGRSRTAVQTTYQTAFYTLSRPLVVGRGLPDDGLTEAYPLGLGRI